MIENNHEHSLLALLRSATDRLTSAGVRWCLLEEPATERSSSAVELVISGATHEAVCYLLEDLPNIHLVRTQTLGVFRIGYALVMRNSRGQLFPLQLNIATEVRAFGLLAYTADAILAGAELSPTGWQVARVTESFVCLLLNFLGDHRNLGSNAIGDVTEALGRLWTQNPAGCVQQLRGRAPDSVIAEVQRIAAAGHWKEFVHRRAAWRWNLWWRAMRADPYRVADCIFQRTWDSFERWFRPAGLVLVISGADEQANANITSSLRSRLERIFRRVDLLSFQPGVLPDFLRSWGAANSAEHFATAGYRVARNSALVWLDYILGYLVRIYPAKVAGGLVVFNGYVDDAFIDTARYRRCVISRHTIRWLPRPDIYFVMDYPVAGICASRKNISPIVVNDLRARYFSWAQRMSGAIVIDGARDEETILREIENIVIHRLERLRKRGLFANL